MWLRREKTVSTFGSPYFLFISSSSSISISSSSSLVGGSLRFPVDGADAVWVSDFTRCETWIWSWGAMPFALSRSGIVVNEGKVPIKAKNLTHPMSGSAQQMLLAHPGLYRARKIGSYSVSPDRICWWIHVHEVCLRIRQTKNSLHLMRHCLLWTFVDFTWFRDALHLFYTTNLMFLDVAEAPNDNLDNTNVCKWRWRIKESVVI